MPPSCARRPVECQRLDHDAINYQQCGPLPSQRVHPDRTDGQQSVTEGDNSGFTEHHLGRQMRDTAGRHHSWGPQEDSTAIDCLSDDRRPSAAGTISNHNDRKILSAGGIERDQATIQNIQRVSLDALGTFLSVQQTLKYSYPALSCLQGFLLLSHEDRRSCFSWS